MECVTTYPDAATVGEFWSKNGVLLPPNDARYAKKEPTLVSTGQQSKWHEKQVKFALTIHSVTRADAGRYGCGVNTSLGESDATLQLRIRDVPVTGMPSHSGRQHGGTCFLHLLTVGRVGGSGDVD